MFIALRKNSFCCYNDNYLKGKIKIKIQRDKILKTNLLFNLAFHKHSRSQNTHLGEFTFSFEILKAFKKFLPQIGVESKYNFSNFLTQNCFRIVF